MHAFPNNHCLGTSSLVCRRQLSCMSGASVPDLPPLPDRKLFEGRVHILVGSVLVPSVVLARLHVIGTCLSVNDQR